MELMSNDEVDKLKLNNNEVDKKKKCLRIKKLTSIQKRKLVDSPFAKYILSESIYILTLCCQ